VDGHQRPAPPRPAERHLRQPAAAEGLLLGVQGSGKTLVAREWGLPLFKMEPARLYDKYIGETEKNLDRALRMPEQMIFVDLLSRSAYS
jgi:SpoVK/Ycf46/Vps4 family AAA+-type ATPase